MKNIKVVVTRDIAHRVESVKSIRNVFGIGLKESLDIISQIGEHTLSVSDVRAKEMAEDTIYDRDLDILKNNGVVVIVDSVGTLIRKINDLAKEAIDIGHEEIGKSLLEIVVVEKLRHASK